MQRGARVLVVDDMPENVSLMREWLEEAGHDVRSAGDGVAALEKAFAQPPDLVIMDVTMPRMDGFTACRALKDDERTHLVPVLLVTALTAREDRIRGAAAGADDFLTKPVDEEQLLARVKTALRTKALIDELEQAENVLVSLANALDAKDSYTRGHADRVSRFAEALGASAGIGPAGCRDLRRAGLLHDIGKIGIPLTYLQKPGRLTTEEYELVKQHPRIGHDICQPLRTMASILPLILSHHERLDGRGYPEGLSGDAVTLPMRCLTIADVYDALTSDRPYRRAMTRDGALRVMREEASVGMWDVRLIELLADTIKD
jgi:putative two-component system response regulator